MRTLRSRRTPAVRRRASSASSYVSEDDRTYHRRLVGNSECGGADRHRLTDPSSLAVVNVDKRLPSRDARTGLRMEHNTNGRIDVVADVRPPGTEEVRGHAVRTRLDGSHEAVAWRDKLFTLADGGQQ